MSVLRADRAFAALISAALVWTNAAWAQDDGSFPVYWDQAFPQELQRPDESARPAAPSAPPAVPRTQFGVEISPPGGPQQAAPGRASAPVILGPAPGLQNAQPAPPPSRAAAPGAPVQLWPPPASAPQSRESVTPLPPPVQLGAPPGTQQAQPRPPTQLPVVNPASPAPQRSATARPDRDAIGALSTTNGGLGPEIWRGTNRDMALRVLQATPESADSPVIRNLVIRTLLSRARAPEGLDPVSWTRARFRKLFDIGELLEAVELAHAASDQFDDEELSRRAVEALLLAGEEEGACLDVRAKAGVFTTDFWPKALVYCGFEAGEQKAAQSLAATLRERGLEDPLFFALVDARGGAKVALPGLRDLSPLNLAMAQAAKVPVPADSFSVQDSTRLAAIARQTNLPAEIRLRAAERASQAGTLSAEGLAAVYRSVPAAAGSEAAANASIYRSIRSERSMGKRAELLARWFQRARWPADPATRLRLDMIRPLDATPLTTPLAPYAAKALLASGDPEMAWPWYEMAAKSQSPDARRQVDLLWPLALMYDRNQLDQARMRRWIDTVNQMPNGADRVARTLSVLDALGFQVNSAPIPAGGRPATVDQAGVLQQLNAAASARRVGETALLCSIALGRGGMGSADPAVVATVIRSLRLAGLELEARAAAREALAAAIS